ncbi:membrane fusion protein (multidrug efflux system) [Luteibacter sp. Sphag1AF]|uniref:HlyD family secretion protein n=1 Tax=Luteibacter sp. Sphag1AF TaxID=2587031 RepID=UPI001826181C|nr:HlyD family secretion protein [Luteibacter sp. Sphag1AF]MBB3226542.1 membrane fusion protein (multidrug efflux system) [Luteibacter sp. Sphag1AF]
MINRNAPHVIVGEAGSWARRKPLAVLAMAAGVVVLVAALMYWWIVARYHESTDDAYVRADIVSVSPRVSGYVATVLVQDNQEVKAGDVLAHIDDRDYAAHVAFATSNVAAAKADIAGREAAITHLDAQAAEQTSQIAAAEAELEAREAAARKASLEMDRQKSLRREQIASEQQWEAAQADAAMSASATAAARARLSAARQALTSLRTDRVRAQAALDGAHAELAKAQASFDLASLDLAHTEIRAPAAGMVGQRSLRAGQYVAVGTPLLAIVPRQTYVVANFKETQLGRVQRGQPVDVEVDALGGRVVHGHVESFAPASGAEFALLPPDNATGNFTKVVQRMPLRIALDGDSAALLRPGMSVVTTIDTHSR